MQIPTASRFSSDFCTSPPLLSPLAKKRKVGWIKKFCFTIFLLDNVRFVTAVSVALIRVLYRQAVVTGRVVWKAYADRRLLSALCFMRHSNGGEYSVNTLRNTRAIFGIPTQSSTILAQSSTIPPQSSAYSSVLSGCALRAMRKFVKAFVFCLSIEQLVSDCEAFYCELFFYRQEQSRTSRGRVVDELRTNGRLSRCSAKLDGNRKWVLRIVVSERNFEWESFTKEAPSRTAVSLWTLSQARKRLVSEPEVCN